MNILDFKNFASNHNSTKLKGLKVMFYSKLKTVVMKLRSLFYIAIAFLLSTASLSYAAGGGIELKKQDWSFNGIFGKYDRAQLRRGFKVYQEVCSGCHSLNRVYYRNLSEPGGPELPEDVVKSIAAEVMVIDGPNDEGEMFDRPAALSDKFVSPFPNTKAAEAANNGVAPPDLSLMAKARVDGPNYIYSLMTGYSDPPEGLDVGDLSFNKYFPGHRISMAQPLHGDDVGYDDGAKPTLENHSRDVSAFLMWTAEPKLEARKSLGIKVLIYLSILAALLYLCKLKIWSRVKH